VNEVFGYAPRRSLMNSGIFEEIQPDKEDFEKFRMHMEEKNKIFLSGKDKYVPYIAKKIKADYVVTFDQNVLIKTEKIRKKFGLEYMKAMTNVGLIKYLYDEKKFKFDEYTKIVLEYFKYVEMQNIFNAITNPDRGWDLKSVKERFQLYKDPLLDALKEKVADGAQIKVGMYG
jgi:hypothetical protein